MGSVGEMSAPNSKQSMGRRPRPEEGGDAPREPSHHGRREQHADRGQHRDRPLVAAQLSEVHMQGAGEEQEPEHAVQQGFVEVDPPDQGARPLTHGRHDRPDHGEDGGEEQRDNHQADGRGLPQQAKVQVAEQCDQNNQNCDQSRIGSLDLPRSSTARRSVADAGLRGARCRGERIADSSSASSSGEALHQDLRPGRGSRRAERGHPRASSESIRRRVETIFPAQR